MEKQDFLNIIKELEIKTERVFKKIRKCLNSTELDGELVVYLEILGMLIQKAEKIFENA